MLLDYFVLGALSLLLLNLHGVNSKSGSTELEAEDLAELIVPAMNIPTGVLEDEDNTDDPSGPLFLRRITKKGLSTFTPLRSLLSWKENDTASFGSILQIKLAIEAMHQKHESLINHIKCVFPETPTNCSNMQPQSSKWNWTSWIPSGYKPHNFFHNDSEKEVGPIAAVFIAAIEHLEKKQNSIYEFLNCTCEKKSNCTAKPSWHVFNSTYWHSKLNKLNPFKWHVFNIAKPHHKPSSGYYSGTLIHKPILAVFNHSAEAGSQTGFVVAVTGGHVPSFPSGVYGGAEEPTDGNDTESGGFGGYISASIPTYSGSIIVGNFPHNPSSGQQSASASEHSQVQIHTLHHSNSTSNTVQQVTSTVNQSSSASSNSASNVSIAGGGSATAAAGGQSLTNSIPVPKEGESNNSTSTPSAAANNSTEANKPVSK